MKKIGFTILVVLLSFSVLAFAMDIPPPFEKIKQWAMLEKPDQDGDYINRISIIKEGEEIRFRLSWIKSSNIIGIFKSDYGGVLYDINSGEFYLFYGGYFFHIDKEKAIEGAYIIFRELVSEKII